MNLNIDPRIVLKDAYKLLEHQRGLKLDIVVGSIEYRMVYLFGNFIIVAKDLENDRMYHISDPINTVDDFIKFTDNQPISEIILNYDDPHLGEQMILLFDCRGNNCMDVKRIAAKKIQKRFRKSRGYAEWEGNPNREYRRIKAEGLFKNDHSSDNSRYNNETGVWGPNAFGKSKCNLTGINKMCKYLQKL